MDGYTCLPVCFDTGCVPTLIAGYGNTFKNAAGLLSVPRSVFMESAIPFSTLFSVMSIKFASVPV